MSSFSNDREIEFHKNMGAIQKLNDIRTYRKLANYQMRPKL
ncbi:hypothetical protein LEP1GSC077_3797 [Leptospira interrogans str. C10069]|nr:hypothetical protein LEP1GSC077_3797 [Leptospira interrogans str. C10069]